MYCCSAEQRLWILVSGDLAAVAVRLPCPEQGWNNPFCKRMQNGIISMGWHPAPPRSSNLNCQSLNPFNLQIWWLISQLFENVDLGFTPVGCPTKVRLKLTSVWEVLWVSRVCEGLNPPAPVDTRLALQPAACLSCVVTYSDRRKEKRSRQKKQGRNVNRIALIHNSTSSLVRKPLLNQTNYEVSAALKSSCQQCYCKKWPWVLLVCYNC